MRILTVNAGSSSLKLVVLDGVEVTARTNLPTTRGGIDAEGLAHFVTAAGTLDAVGHRIVHGGTQFSGPVRIDGPVRDALEELTDLAPLHQPKSLAALDAVTALIPTVPAVACFDTAFHASIPPAAATYAIPAEWRRRWPLRRFGFHGLSHAYAGRRAAQMVERPLASLRTVTCHLGAGASLCAIDRGESVDTTMGFTPLEGLVMATRSGDVDPGLVLWLEQHAGLRADELAETLEHRSGLLGLAGSADMRQVLEAEDRGDPDAVLAVAVYLHRLRAAIAAVSAALGGLDVLVFTGGVGERAVSIRRRAADGLAFLGVAVEPAVNEAVAPDADLTRPGAPVRTLVIEAREDLEIAAEVERLLGG